MRAKLTTATLVLIGLLAIAAQPATAATPIRVEIPFEFTINGSSLPSGDYVVTLHERGIVRVRSGDGGRSVAAFASAVNDGEAQDQTLLVFERSGDGTVLVEVRVPTSRGGLQIAPRRTRENSGSNSDGVMAIVIVADPEPTG